MASTKPDPYGPPTRWTILDAALGRIEGADREEAWKELVDRYREPIRMTIRSRARAHFPPSRADEIVDDFFGYLVVQNVLPRIDRERGTFRGYIQRVVHYFVADRVGQDHRAPAPMPEDVEFEAEDGDPTRVDHEELAEWVRAILARACEQLLRSKPRDGRILLKLQGIAPYDKTPTAQVAKEENMTEGAIYQATHRAKALLTRAVRDEIRDTSRPSDFASEFEAIQAEILELHPGIL